MFEHFAVRQFLKQNDFEAYFNMTFKTTGAETLCAVQRAAAVPRQVVRTWPERDILWHHNKDNTLYDNITW